MEDEEQTRPDSPRAGAAMRYTEDGLRATEGNGRLRRVEEIVKLDDEGRPTPDPRVWITSYRYDLLDNFKGYTDSQGNRKEFRYDALRRKTFMNDPDRGEMHWRYDDGSNLVESRDAKGQVIRFTYDGVNRLLTEDYLDETKPIVTAGLTFDPARPVSPTNRPDVAYFYDAPVANLDIGNLTIATAQNTRGFLSYVWDLTGEEHTSYDARGRVAWVVKRISDPAVASFPSASRAEDRGEEALVSYRTAFAYDSLDRVTRITYPDDDFVFYRYNARNLLDRIHGGQVIAALATSNILAGIAYRASAQFARINYGNGVESSYDYDSRLRLTSLVTRHSSLGAELVHFAYAFDEASNIERIEDRRPLSTVPAGDPRRNTQHFRYDDLYRLTEARYGFGLPNDLAREDGRIHYRYDRIGNMLEQTSTIEQFDRGVPVTNLGQMESGGAAGRSGRAGRAAGDPPGPHALSAIRHSSRATRHFPYDANGNMLVIDGLTNTWDFKDRLIRVENAEMIADYGYDYTDRRVTKRVQRKNNLSASGGEARSEVASVLYADKHFEVREHDAPVKYVWNGGARVARVTGSLSPSLRVQRLRLYPGWNLVSLAVDVVAADARRLNLSDQSSVTSPTIEAAFRWHQPTLGWVPVTPNDTLAAGTVLWLRATTNATVALTGTYAEPSNRIAPAGPSFQPGAGLEAWPLTNAPLTHLTAWAFDRAAQNWGVRYGAILSGQSDFPEVLAAGHGFMVRADAATPLEVPESTLRIRFYHQDHLGSSSVMTDAAGHLIEETAYSPFGHPRQQHQPRGLAEPHGFSQKERDEETRLAYFEARYLFADTGRFLSCDPANLGFRESDAQSKNPYSYARSNPIKLTDPKGTAFYVAAAVFAGFFAYDVVSSAIDVGREHAEIQKLPPGDPRRDSITPAFSPIESAITAPMKGSQGFVEEVARKTPTFVRSTATTIGNKFDAKSRAMTIGNKLAPLTKRILNKPIIQEGLSELGDRMIENGAKEALDEIGRQQRQSIPTEPSPGPEPVPVGPPPANERPPGSLDINSNRG
ncbi:MAG: RHS repeat-associated core domain-containing protein [Verrucomicrobiota bacterium]